MVRIGPLRCVLVWQFWYGMVGKLRFVGVRCGPAVEVRSDTVGSDWPGLGSVWKGRAALVR